MAVSIATNGRHSNRRTLPSFATIWPVERRPKHKESYPSTGLDPGHLFLRMGQPPWAGSGKLRLSTDLRDSSAGRAGYAACLWSGRSKERQKCFRIASRLPHSLLPASARLPAAVTSPLDRTRFPTPAAAQNAGAPCRPRPHPRPRQRRRIAASRRPKAVVSDASPKATAAPAKDAKPRTSRRPTKRADVVRGRRASRQPPAQSRATNRRRN